MRRRSMRSAQAGFVAALCWLALLAALAVLIRPAAVAAEETGPSNAPRAPTPTPAPTPAQETATPARAAPPVPISPPGPAGPNAPPTTADVEITFGPSRQALSVGDTWSISGEIVNRLREPIWIVDTKTILVMPPEVFGDRPSGTDSGFTLYALLATGRFDDEFRHDQVVRIDAGSRYPVLWMWRGPNPIETLLGHSYFSPGSYRATILLHYWLEEPRFKGETAPDGRIVNRVLESDRTATTTASRDITFDSAIWVLLFGASAGGVVSRIVQLVTHRPDSLQRRRTRGNRTDKVLGWLSEFFAAVLLPVVVTIVISRLSSVDSPIALRVRDFWGAVAMGFLVQWLGIAWFNKIMPGGEEDGGDRPGEKPQMARTRAEARNRPAAAVNGATDAPHVPALEEPAHAQDGAPRAQGQQPRRPEAGSSPDATPGGGR